MKRSFWYMLFISLTMQQSYAESPKNLMNPLIDITVLIPRIQLDMRYASANNFTGHRVTGYTAAKCLLHTPVAEALMRVEQGLQKNGYGLIIYDCYRPTIAVDDFMRWSKDLNNTSTKARYYPNLDKSKLVPDYIAEKSGHSKGATLDLGLLDCRTEPCITLDMGTEFDFFGEQANTNYPNLTDSQRQNRTQLLTAMNEQGFENYPMEWWHYTWKAGVLPDQAYSFPIQ